MKTNKLRSATNFSHNGLKENIVELSTEFKAFSNLYSKLEEDLIFNNYACLETLDAVQSVVQNIRELENQLLVLKSTIDRTPRLLRAIKGNLRSAETAHTNTLGNK